MITWVDYLSAAVLLLFVGLPMFTGLRAYSRARVVPALPDQNATLRQDWQTPARRLRLACLNRPAVKGFSQAPAGGSRPNGRSSGSHQLAVTGEDHGRFSTPPQTVPACADQGRSPAAVTGESAATSRIIRFATRQGGR